MAADTNPQTRLNAVQEAVKWLDADHDRIEAAVGGAAIGLFAWLSREGWPITLALSSTAVILMKKYVYPMLKKQG